MIPPLIPLVVVCLAYVLGCIALMTVEFREKLAFALLAASVALGVVAIGLFIFKGHWAPLIF